MKTSDAGRTMIEGFEGLRLIAYPDDNNVWTIGFGHTSGVKKGDKCTAAQADAWLLQDLETAERGVIASVHVGLSQPQFDALVSLAFNIGVGAFVASTTAHLVNSSDYYGAAEAITMWRRVGTGYPEYQRARRAREMRVFLVGY